MNTNAANRAFRICGTGAYLNRSCYRARFLQSSYSQSRHLRLDVSTRALGDHNTGHLEAKPDEGILYFGNLYPLRLQWFWRAFSQSEAIIEKVDSASTGAAAYNPSELLREALKDKVDLSVNTVAPRVKEGGAFVRFQYPPDSSLEEIEGVLHKYLNKRELKPWWNPFDRVHANLVQGRPWMEDLRRPVCSLLRVEFEPCGGPETPVLSQEQLYSLFRPYGKLLEISPQPQDSKILPKYGNVSFAALKRAIMARNVLHGMIVKDDTTGEALARLKISYEKNPRTGWILEWLTNHPRVVIPVLAALIATLSVTIFDPIRSLFVKLHVTGTFDVSRNRIVQWIMSQTAKVSGALSLGKRRERDLAGMQAIWDDRKEDVEQIRKWLLESQDTFIVVQGPRGAGKQELVMGEALKNVKHKLVIDCKAIQEARGDNGTINETARSVGYRPVFSWMNGISNMIDLAVQGTTGVKTGFSETVDAQLDKIFNCTSVALREVGVSERKKSDTDADLADDVYLEAHPEKRPVVVIDNFLHKSGENTRIYDKIADWAANLTSSNIAHVIFLTSDVSFAKSLGKALPDRVLRQIMLGDSPPEVSKRFVISHLDAYPDEDLSGEKSDMTPSQKRTDLHELDECIEALGGRLTELEFLARRMRSGESPKKAVNEIVHQTVSEVMKMFVLDMDQDKSWNAQQVWYLINELAKSNGELKYNEVVVGGTFGSGASADSKLQAMEQAELISIISSNGRPSVIKPGKPVYLPAFKLLAKDPVLQARMNIAQLNQTVSDANITIEKLEQELKLLGDLPTRPAEAAIRVKYLLGKLQATQTSVEESEKKISEYTKVMQTQY